MRTFLGFCARARCSRPPPVQVLCLGVVGQDCATTHTVVSGDFCALIAGAAGIDASTLLANNPNVNSDCSNIYPDEVRLYDDCVCIRADLFCVFTCRSSARRRSSSRIPIRPTCELEEPVFWRAFWGHNLGPFTACVRYTCIDYL